MIYAIGEIILVVIGILIALQINTWKEEKGARAFVVRVTPCPAAVSLPAR